MTEKEIDLVVERLTRRVENANIYFLKQIGEYIKQIRDLSPTEAHKLVQILKYGGNYQQIIKALAEFSKMNVSDIDKIFNRYAKQDYNFYKQFYKYRNMDFIPFEKNKEIIEQTNAIKRLVQKQVYNIMHENVIGYTIRDRKGNIQFQGLRETYNRVLDEALMNVSEGKETFDSAMSRIMEDIGGSGLKKLDYDSGRSVRLDSAIRMNLQDGLRELHNINQETIGEEFGYDGYEISVHENPAVDHEKVQGRQFRKAEFEKLQNGDYAKDINGKEFTLDHDHKNGFRPISEMNCYHVVKAIIIGVSKPSYTEEQLEQIRKRNDDGFKYNGKHYTMYQGTQIQRNIERKIREQKDIQILAKASGNDNLALSSQANIDRLTKKYKEFNDISGLRPKLDRIQVNGYKRVEIQQNVNLNENEIFISKEKQYQRINYRKEYLNERIRINEEGLNSIPIDSTKNWDITRRKVYQSDLNKYNKELIELNNKSISNKIIKLNTKEDAKELLKEININLNDKNLDNIDTDVVISTSKKYYELSEKYPFLDQSLQEKKLNLKFENLTSGNIGEAERSGMNIGLDIDNFRKKEDVIYWGEYQTKNKYNMPCSKENYINYFQTHEIGHIFNYRVIDNVEISQFEDLSAREFTKKTNEYFIDNIYKIAEKNSGKSKKELTDLLSDYAKTNEDETLAELFANANCGKPNELGKAFDEYFKELLK